MPAFLKIVHRDKREENLLCVNVMTIGRDKSSSICLQDPMVSRNHGIIRAVGRDQYYLLDTGSRNGIYHNTRRISSPVLLRNKDLVTIGDSIITFSQEDNSLEETHDGTGKDIDFTETMHSLKADIRSIVVLVSDIRGFTTLSEKLPIEVLTELMSTWFQEVQDIVEKNYGMVDKFIGDCVLARWEVETGNTKSLIHSLRCAVELNRYTSKLHEKFKAIDKPLKIGVGLNQGEAAVGIGVDNTIMGDVVNTAFRLETASKDIGCDVVINSNFYKLLPNSFPVKNEKKILVKGKESQLTITALSFTEIENFLQIN
jgi:adenylate cyclase